MKGKQLIEICKLSDCGNCQCKYECCRFYKVLKEEYGVRLRPYEVNYKAKKDLILEISEREF